MSLTIIKQDLLFLYKNAINFFLKSPQSYAMANLKATREQPDAAWSF